MVQWHKHYLLQGSRPVHSRWYKYFYLLVLFVFLYQYDFTIVLLLLKPEMAELIRKWINELPKICNSIKIDKENTITALWVTTLGLFVVTPQYFDVQVDLREIVAVMFSHWKVISWSWYAEAVHVRYRLVHLCFLNEGVNKNNSLRIFSSVFFFFFSFFPLGIMCGTVSFSASAVLLFFYCRRNLSGALGHHQSYKMHNIIKKHINESKWNQ